MHTKLLLGPQLVPLMVCLTYLKGLVPAPRLGVKLFLLFIFAVRLSLERMFPSARQILAY